MMVAIRSSRKGMLIFDSGWEPLVTMKLEVVELVPWLRFVGRCGMLLPETCVALKPAHRDESCFPTWYQEQFDRTIPYFDINFPTILRCVEIRTAWDAANELFQHPRYSDLRFNVK